MTVNIFGVQEMAAGLNNQKLIMLGLSVIAAENNGEISLPALVHDYAPTAEGRGKGFLPIEDVFDITLLEEVLKPASAEATDVKTWAECFRTGGGALGAEQEGSPQETARSRTAMILASMQGCEVIEAEAERIVQSLPDQTIAVQLRVERDWRNYIELKRQNGQYSTRQRDVIIDPAPIFAKIRRQSSFSNVKNLFLCCDEDDLVQTHAEIAGAAREHDFNVIFKSQLSSAFLDSRLKRSVLDFSVCLKFESYIGLSLSTFSNILCVTKACQLNSNPDHYIYDARDEAVVKRFDLGRSVLPALITKPRM